jgi:hypothetical protein
MSISTSEGSIDISEEDFPAPVCDTCEVPMLGRSRVFYNQYPKKRERLGFACPQCARTINLPKQKITEIDSLSSMAIYPKLVFARPSG